MAIPSPITTDRITKSVKSFNNSISNVRKTTSGIIQNLDGKVKRKKSLFSLENLVFFRKREASRRKKQEELVEASKGTSILSNPMAAIKNTAKGFMGRLLDFVGSLLLGWALNNLPTILFMIREFIGRVNRVFSIGKAFIVDIGSAILGFGKLLGAVGTNIITLDFFDRERRVSSALSDLTNVFDDMKYQIEEGIKTVTTPLNINLETGEQAPDFGTQYPAQPEPGGGQAVTEITGIQKQALDIISGPESSGSYNAMNQGTINDRIVGSTIDSKTKLNKSLTSMTIGEVLQRQNWLMDRKNPQVSNYGIYAAGRYQFIPNTLPGVMKAAGLTPSDPFSPTNQDLMALALLKERGIQPWTIGGSRYSAKELEIVEKARRMPIVTRQVEQQRQSQPQQILPGRPQNIPTLNLAQRYFKEQNVAGQIGRGVITSLYRTANRPSHNGIDIYVPTGTYIALKVDCEIIDYGNTNPTGYGNEMHIWVPQYSIRLKLAHLSGAIITSGKVPAGKSFARSGRSGRSTGPHIHLEAGPRNSYKGDRDPSPYVPLLWLTDGPNSPFARTAQAQQNVIPSQITAPARIASNQQPRVQQTQQLAQRSSSTRTGPTVIIAQQPPPPPQRQQPSSSGGGLIPIPIASNTLNKYVNNKILLDLSYT